MAEQPAHAEVERISRSAAASASASELLEALGRKTARALIVDMGGRDLALPSLEVLMQRATAMEADGNLTNARRCLRNLRKVSKLVGSRARVKK